MNWNFETFLKSFDLNQIDLNQTKTRKIAQRSRKSPRKSPVRLVRQSITVLYDTQLLEVLHYGADVAYEVRVETRARAWRRGQREEAFAGRKHLLAALVDVR